MTDLENAFMYIGIGVVGFFAIIGVLIVIRAVRNNNSD